jgi:hypothetical protein
MIRCSWWEDWKLDNYHWLNWWRGGTPWDLAPMTNHQDIRPSTHRWNQPTQSRHIDMKARMGWTKVQCSTIPSGTERANLQDTHASPKVSKYYLHGRRTHTRWLSFQSQHYLLQVKNTWNICTTRNPPRWIWMHKTFNMWKVAFVEHMRNFLFNPA